MNNNTQTVSKFNPGMTVSYSKFSGCVMPGVKAEIIGNEYTVNQSYSGWIYSLKNEILGGDIPCIIEEIWLELVIPQTDLECMKYSLAAADSDRDVRVPKTEEWYSLRKFLARQSVPGHGFEEGIETYFIKHHIKKWKQIIAEQQ